MSVIKQISVYDGSSWGEPHDIGAKVENVTLSSNIAGSTVLGTALNNILPDTLLTPNTILIADPNKKIKSSSIGSGKLSFLSNVSSDIQNQLDNKVNKSGDTMTGVLFGNNTSLCVYDTDLPAISSTATNYYGKGYLVRFRDKGNTDEYGCMRTFHGTDKSEGIQIGFHRVAYGSTTNNNIYLTTGSNNSKPVVAFGSKGDIAWRDALGINDSISTITFDSMTCNSGSTATFSRKIDGVSNSKIVFSPGTYIVVTMASIPYGNANGYRWIWWASASNGGNIDRYCVKKEAPCSGGNTVTLVNLFNFTASTTYWLKMSQNSGSSISNCYAGVRYLKIHP